VKGHRTAHMLDKGVRPPAFDSKLIAGKSHGLLTRHPVHEVVTDDVHPRLRVMLAELPGHGDNIWVCGLKIAVTSRISELSRPLHFGHGVVAGVRVDHLALVVDNPCAGRIGILCACYLGSDLPWKGEGTASQH